MAALELDVPQKLRGSEFATAAGPLELNCRNQAISLSDRGLVPVSVSCGVVVG
jgi:hypothetical protein